MTPLSQTMLYPWHRWVKLCCIHDTAESNYAVSMTPLSQTMLYPWHRWVKLCGIHDTAELNYAVSAEAFFAVYLTSLSQTEQYPWHRWVKLTDIFTVTLLHRNRTSTLSYFETIFIIFWAISSFFFKGGFGKIICRYSFSTKTYTIIILKRVVTLKEPSRQITFAFA